MQTVIDILEELEATPGSLAKREILHCNRKHPLLKKVFVAAGDPYVAYYVSKFKMPPVNKSQASHDVDDDDFVADYLDFITTKLATRELTGNAARDALVAKFAAFDTQKLQKWCERILLKNLRCGVQESTVNKIWPGTLKSFAVALAATLKSDFVKDEGIKILETVAYPVRVEPKLDGLRCIAVKKEGVVTFYTRNGTILDTLPTIKTALEQAPYDDVVLDGEGMGVDWADSASVLMSAKSKKDDSNIVYNVFDAVPLHDWVAQQTSLTYAARCQLVRDVVDSIEERRCAVERKCGQSIRQCVKQVPHVTARDEDELKRFFAQCLDDGFEGVMLKTLDTTYEWKRSRNILKLKPCVTYEGIVVGHYEGRKNTKREGLFGGFEVMLPNGVVTKAGGGFNDALRAQIQLDGPDNWIGKIVECEAQPDPMTTDGLTEDGKMRFPVYVRTRDISDVSPELVELSQQFSTSKSRSEGRYVPGNTTP